MSKRSILFLGLAVATLIGFILLVYGVDGLGLRESTTVSTEKIDSQGVKTTIQIYQRTVWDLLDLLIVPLVLVLGGFLLNRAEQKRQADRAKERADAEHEQALDRAREDRLQVYLDRMQDLLEKGLKDTLPKSVLRDVARARTLTALRALNGERNGFLLNFLRYSDLITGDSPVISLSDAYLRRADLNWVDLLELDLRGANLIEADLSWANLIEADLSWALLMGANLHGADLTDADLRSAGLMDADLSEADVRGAEYDDFTRWPDGFDPVREGAKKVDQEPPNEVNADDSKPA